jgi:hypothetical protein
MKLDAVYTWVDPTRMEWIAERKKYLFQHTHQGPSTDFSRFQSFDEIKYSLRSLKKYCDFIDRVFIVSNLGARPKWLVETPEVVVIDDRAIFPEGSLIPNYNSNAIESCLHHIPGLSPTFLYLNDDFLITQPLRIQDLIDPDSGQFVVFMESDPLIRLYNQTLSAFLPEIHHLGGGAAKARRYTYERLGLESTNQVPIGHCPRIYQKNLVEAFEIVYSKEIEDTRCQRFRTADSFCFCDAYAYHYERLGIARLDFNHKAKLIIFTDSDYLNRLQINQASKVLNQTNFLALLDVRTKINPRNVRQVQDFLQRIYPERCNFEL